MKIVGDMQAVLKEQVQKRIKELKQHAADIAIMGGRRISRDDKKTIEAHLEGQIKALQDFEKVVIKQAQDLKAGNTGDLSAFMNGQDPAKLAVHLVTLAAMLVSDRLDPCSINNQILDRLFASERYAPFCKDFPLARPLLVLAANACKPPPFAPAKPAPR